MTYGSKEIVRCTGLEALYLSALESGVSVVTGVAGYPITEVMEYFLSSKITPGTEADSEFSVFRPEVKWLTNEKVALEIALGASASGRRALVLVKHVGMNILSDPLITSVTHTIGAGLVIFAGDDPGARGSQNEQDSRWYGSIAEVAVFDPKDPDAAYLAVRRAYELSEQVKAPVIVRITSNLEKSEGEVKRLPKGSGTPKEFDRSIWEVRTREKHQLFHNTAYPLLEKEAETTTLNVLHEGRPQKTECGPKGLFSQGIISSGFMSSLVEKLLKEHPGISHFSLNLVSPLPFRKLADFLKRHSRILVVEESEPVIEQQVCIAGNVYGKKTGHLPYGKVTAEDIEFALERLEEEYVINTPGPEELERRKRSRKGICEDCPYLSLYRLLNRVEARVAGDMGCSIRSAPEPLAAVDVCFALGSAISVACGFEKKGIAVIGDFALAHSGILGLLNAINGGYGVLVLVLQNEVAAMTGGQEAPDLSRVVRALVPAALSYDIDKNVLETENGTVPTGLSGLIKEKLQEPGVSVIFVKGKCRRHL